MTSIYSELNTKINDVLASVTKIKKIYPYPATKIDGYPAALYFPASINNAYETTSDNYKTYGYKIYIVIGTNSTTINQVFESIMPNVIDEVLAAFDSQWDFNTINGHRIWSTIDTGLWTVSEEQDGLEVTSEIDLSIKMLTTN